MTRRPLLAGLAALAGVILTATHLPAAGPAASPAAAAQVPVRAAANTTPDRPNIVLITTDDQRAADMRWMPKTRQLLGRHGVTFTSSLSPHPLCCPARAEILTGTYAHNNGVRTNFGRYGGYGALKTKETLGVWLTKAGYGTAFVGKHLNEYEKSRHRDPGWTIWDPTISGVYDFYRFTQYNNGAFTSHDGYITDYVARRTGEYAGRLGADGRPFFVWASYVAPHVAWYDDRGGWGPPKPAPRHRGLYRDAKLDTRGKRSFNEKNVGDKPAAIRGLRKADPAQLRALHRARLRSLAGVDDAVATTVNALRRNGQLANTVIMFTSDNGYLLGEHRFDGKELPYEEALRVPLLVRGPGVARDKRTGQVATTVDLPATILSLAGALRHVPWKLDGQDLTRVLRRPARERLAGTTELIQAGPRWASQEKFGWLYRGVRTGRYTYVRWNTQKFVELYDRKRDPLQLRNVAGDRRYRAIRRELNRRLDALIDCRGRDCHGRFGPLPDPKPKRTPAAPEPPPTSGPLPASPETTDPTPEPAPEPSPSADPAPTPTVTADPTTAPEPTAAPEPSPSSAPEPTEGPTSSAEPAPGT